MKHYLAETNQKKEVFFEKSNKPSIQQHHRFNGLRHKMNGPYKIHKGQSLNLPNATIRIKRPKNILNTSNNNKRRVIAQNRDAFNDYLTVTVGKSAILDCNLENYNNEKVN